MDKQFRIYSPIPDKDIEKLQDSLKIVFDENINDLEKAADIDKFPKFCEFIDSHTETDVLFSSKKVFQFGMSFPQEIEGSM